jgi:hypothetical protein
MRRLSIRLPEHLLAHIEAEARDSKLSKSAVVRLRLESAMSLPSQIPLEAFADLIGSVDGLPADLSTQKKKYLKSTGYGGKRAR